MSGPDNFHVLTERVRLQGTLITRTGLRVGSGGSDDLDAVDLPVLRDADGLPFIPGASLKGVVRTTLEALLRGADTRGRGLWACDPLDRKDACGEYDSKAYRSRDDVPVDDHCTVCSLLGSHLVSSHVRFSDALLVDRDGPAPVSVRHGVGIDRDLRSARDGLLYDFEVINPGARFDLEVFVDNPEPHLMGLLALGFDQLAEGFTGIGGFTSRGLGRVELNWRSIWRVRAPDLLAGKQPETFDDTDALEAEMQVWRDALTRVVDGKEVH